MISPMKMIRWFLCVAVSAVTVVAADPATEFPKADVPPRPIKQGPPVYPHGLRAAGIVGRVTLDAVLDTEGRVAEVHVARSNNPFFERSAIDAVMKWRFSPALKQGKPVKTRIRQEINFMMEGVSTRDLWEVTPPRDWGKAPEEFRWTVAPEPVSTLMAAYPFEALREKKAGKVTVSYVIDREGRVIMTKVREATAPEFAAAVVAMIDGWRFKPARKADGSAAYAIVTVTREFAPDGLGDVPVSDGAKWLVDRLRKNKLESVPVNELDAPPKAISQRPPVYPSPLRQAGQDGEAMVEFFVDENGDALLPRVVSATAPEFGYASVQAVATWRFTAPKKGGKAVIARAQQTLKFHLKEPFTPPAGEFLP